ncbi:hypothetical protein Dsin_010492 [Dipteronia sinensis]|uniref:Uncharacterized protein n=1 Tax=Dipteronia sinensis TaxID=43782 RepID=A0AAE0ATT7_9ROSI|nr:hypothetical protein Dsin_010492 [Dipteronia sinensis]
MSHNEVAQEFNRQLKDRVVSQLRLRLTDAALPIDLDTVMGTMVRIIVFNAQPLKTISVGMAFIILMLQISGWPTRFLMVPSQTLQFPSPKHVICDQFRSGNPVLRKY